MVDKKITVLGDAGDASLTPEDEHKIEVKVDRMLAIDNTPAPAELLEHTAPELVESPAAEPATPEVPEPAAIAEPEPAIVDEPVGPPPLSKKIKKITISDASADADEIAIATPEAAAPLVAAKVPEEPAEPEATLEQPEAEPAPEPAPEPVKTEASQKYRPPEGPIPFKRATSLPPTSTELEAAASASLTAEEQEDAAIAAAFAAKEPAAHEKPKRQPHRKSGRKVAVLSLVLIVLIGLAAALLAVPSLRHKLLGTRDKATTAKTTTAPVVSQPPKVTTTAPLPDIFLAKSDGVYNLYKVDQAGQNKQELLAGSGYETSPTTQLVANSTASFAALVSLRDASKDTAGYSLQTLNMVDVATGTATKIIQAQRLELLGWYGTRLVYVASKTAATTSDTNAYQLMSYDTVSKQNQVLDHAAHFNAVLALHDQLYYATDGSTAAVYSIKPDGTSKQTVLSKLASNMYRTDYSSLAIATAGGWYTLDTGSSNAKPVSTVNAYTGVNKLYVDAPDGRTSLHLETRSGTPTLLLYNVTTKKDTVLSQQAGLAYPLHWLTNTTAVYRIDTDTQTADYTINTVTNASAKLIDTSSFTGLEP